jgi:hypothetical protein
MACDIALIHEQYQRINVDTVLPYCNGAPYCRHPTPTKAKGT